MISSGGTRERVAVFPLVYFDRSPFGAQPCDLIVRDSPGKRMVKAASDLFFSGARCVATSLWVKTIALRAGLFGDSVRPTFIHIFSHRTRKKKKKKICCRPYGRFGVGRLSLSHSARAHITSHYSPHSLDSFAVACDAIAFISV